jgi:hypothetical protein
VESPRNCSEQVRYTLLVYQNCIVWCVSSLQDVICFLPKRCDSNLLPLHCTLRALAKDQMHLLAPQLLQLKQRLDTLK